MLETGAELALGEQLGDSWTSEIARLLMKYECADLWDDDCGDSTFCTRISDGIRKYYVKQEWEAIRKSRQAALLNQVMCLFKNSQSNVFTGAHPVLSQLDRIAQPRRTSLLRFICGSFYQNIKSGDGLKVSSCPLCSQKWSEPILHLLGRCPSLNNQRKIWAGEGGTKVWNWKYAAKALGLGDNGDTEKISLAAEFVQTIFEEMTSVWRKKGK